MRRVQAPSGVGLVLDAGCVVIIRRGITDNQQATQYNAIYYFIFFHSNLRWCVARLAPVTSCLHSERVGRPKQNISIFSLAAEFGVSAPTVSKALSNNVEISQDLRARIRARADELGFRPTRPRRRTFNICVVCDLGSSQLFHIDGFRQAVVEGAYSLCSNKGMEFSLLGQSSERLNAMDLTKELLLRNADAAVLIGARTGSAYFQNLEANHFPYVCVFDGPEARTVLLNNGQVGRLAARHLIELGHTRIAVARNLYSRLASRERFMAFVMEAGRLGLPQGAVTELLPDHADAGFEFGRFILQQWLRERPYTAIFCIANHVATGILSEAAVQDIRIPRDLSVLTCDDLPACAEAAPPLSSVDIPNHRAGELATLVLWHQLTGRDNPPDITSPLPVVRIVRRHSTAVPSS